MDIPDLSKLGGLEPGQFDGEAFMRGLADKRTISPQGAVGDSPKEQLAYAVSELGVRLEVMEVMVTHLCQLAGMDDQAVVNFLAEAFEIPDTPEEAINDAD